MNQVAIVWFRRDLRLHDNAALYHALKKNPCVLPVFIFDSDILLKLPNKEDRRVDFIHQALQSLQLKLVEAGSSLHVFYGKPVDVWKKIISEYQISAVYTNHDYEPYAIKRDEEVKNLLQENGIAFKSFKDQCIFEKNEVLKDDGLAYTVFTPYSKKWKNKLNSFYTKAYPTEKYFHSFYKCSPAKIPSLEEIGFKKTDLLFVEPQKPENNFLVNYAAQRDIPSLNATSRLSVHLRFGTISIRELVVHCLGKSEAWLNELIWRDFYMMILYHFPYAASGCFKKQYNYMRWENNEYFFEKWKLGQTGFPIVDAGMRELLATGFMHNRVRMIVSSFLVKDLLINWQWGEAWFSEKLLDFDLSANNGGWQWAAGTGCDAAPYFRIFNPEEQQKKFDSNFEYIKKWVPEFGTAEYPEKIIDRSETRKRTLERYKEVGAL